MSASLFIALLGSIALAQIPAPGGAQNRPDPVQSLARYQNYDVIQGEALVQFKPGTSAEARRALNDAVSTRTSQEIADELIVVQFDGSRSLDEILGRYNANPAVEFAEPNYVYWPTATPNDPKFVQQWGPKKINCPLAWDLASGDPGSVVALIDSGFQMNHPDLKDSYAYGYDYYAGDPLPEDQFGHGTHTAGIAAGEFNNAVGIAGVSGYCHFASYRVGDYYLSNSAIISAINDATAKGALAISMSFGGGGPSTAMQNALNNAYAAGVVCVASAGNDGTTAKNYPAAFSAVIAVASSTSSDTRSSFSTYGSWVEVAAPGSNILSTYLNSSYATMDGTSMSCPHVSGMAVLLYSILGGVRSKTNADIVRNAIFTTAVPVGSWVEYGRVDVAAAVASLANVAPPTLASVSPASVQGFGGNTMTLSGDSLGTATQMTVGGQVLLRDVDFTVVDANTISFPAPMAQSLGPQAVTVTNQTGTSNPVYFSYVETNPIKLTAPFLAQTGQEFTWAYGGGANAPFFLIVAPDSSTFPYKGFNILSNFVIINSGLLNAGGTGKLSFIMPAGFSGTTLYAQFLTNKSGVFEATGVVTSIIFL